MHHGIHHHNLEVLLYLPTPALPLLPRYPTLLPPLHLEIHSVVGLTVVHAHKIYFSVPLIRLVSREPNTSKPHGPPTPEEVSCAGYFPACWEAKPASGSNPTSQTSCTGARKRHKRICIAGQTDWKLVWMRVGAGSEGVADALGRISSNNPNNLNSPNSPNSHRNCQVHAAGLHSAARYSEDLLLL
ncbi:hypothetical protein F5879DRAFT_995166 [Lentinula edodes]|nr:hypothetical protein F5879DRAFT_995166 [Lentinula edodes]